MKPARKKKQRRLDSAEVERLYQESEKFVRERQEKLIEEALAADPELPQLEAKLSADTTRIRYQAPENVVTKEQLIALGGSPRYEKTPETGKPAPSVAAIVFGRENETRLIFTPDNGAWLVNMEGNKSLEELRRELCKNGRNLWDFGEQSPDGAEPRPPGPHIAFKAVEALLDYAEQLKGLPPTEHQKPDALFAILATLQALKQHQGRKLQIAFDLLTDDKRPRLLEKLRDNTWMLSNELQRPPSKKELKNRFDPSGKLEQSEYSKLLKHAGLAWLRRDRKALNLGEVQPKPNDCAFACGVNSQHAKK